MGSVYGCWGSILAPSRIAAQIVTGIGFVGAGVTVLLYLLAVTVISPLIRRLPHQDKRRLLTVRYTGERGERRRGRGGS